MFCRYCGNQQIDAKFCTSCGKPVDELAVQPTKAPTVLMEPSGSNADPPTGVATPPAARIVESVIPPDNSQPTNRTNVSVNVAGPQIIYQDESGSALFVRAIWFVFIGWWAGFFWITLAAILNWTIIGLPLGLMMFNAVPRVMTLKSRNVRLSISTNPDGTYVLTRSHLEQHPLWLRAIYFLLVGWWFSLSWAYAAYFIGLLIVTLPVSFMMFERIPAVTTFARY